MYDQIKQQISMWNEGDFPVAVDSNTCNFCEIKVYCPFSHWRANNKD
jgi:hypothetical protein